MINRFPWFWAQVCVSGLVIFPAVASGLQCNQYYPQRVPWFGDLHVHSSLSLDTRMLHGDVEPLDVFRFARGEAVALRNAGRSQLSSTRVLARPLDFAAVTDHAEMLGEAEICGEPGMPGHRSLYCTGLRWSPQWIGPLFSHAAMRARRLSLCGAAGERCLLAARQPWERLRAAAELAYDRSRNCQFSSFIGYEWTGTAFPDRGVEARLHRNVIFSSAYVPDLPISFIDAPLPDNLYAALAAQCDPQTTGCDAVVIPHSSHLSLGMMFQDSPSWQGSDGREALRLRSRYERLVEVIQHQGAAECVASPDDAPGHDPLCAFEQVAVNNSSFSAFAPSVRSRQTAGDYPREALKRGLRWQREQQVNPFKYGFVGGTGSHLGLAGDVDEHFFAGHGGTGAASSAFQAAGMPERIEFNPGGLTVLYAEQNTREALFAALKRRESYATSGPRMAVRFFGGAELPRDYCERSDRLEQAYRLGVPMGADLPVSDKAPRFAVSAMKDPGVKGSPGVDLQRIQIIKGWLDHEGTLRERVYDVAGDPGGGELSGVDGCAAPRGHPTLCRVWQDPEFDPRDAAFYYARVLQQPSCRWSSRVCQELAVDCSSREVLTGPAAGCCSARVPTAIQERAWTSPIWHTPVGAALPKTH